MDYGQSGSLTSDLTAKTQWLHPTPSHSCIAFICPYSQFSCRNEISQEPWGSSVKLFQEWICSGISEFCSCHRGEDDLGFNWSLQDVSSGFALWLLCSRKNSQAVQSLAQCWNFSACCCFTCNFNFLKIVSHTERKKPEIIFQNPICNCVFKRMQ